MANADINFKNRVKDTTTTTGTGDITLAGSPPTGYQSFNAAFGTGVYFYYCIEGGSEWEVGRGHLSASTTLVRDNIYESTNSNNAVNFSAGTKNVFCTNAANDAQDKWRTIIKANNTDRTSTTTLAADPHLTIALLPAFTYAIRLTAIATVPSTNPGFKFRYNCTQTPQAVFATIRYHSAFISAPASATMIERWNVSNPGETLTITGSNYATIEMRVQLVSHATLASIFDFEWAQNSSHADAASVRFGSTIQYIATPFV